MLTKCVSRDSLRYSVWRPRTYRSGPHTPTVRSVTVFVWWLCSAEVREVSFYVSHSYVLHVVRDE